MDAEVPILSGYLNVPTQSGFPLHRISKKKSCQKYCLLFKSSRYGIERLEICETKDDKYPKIITLENCVKITQEPPPANLICIVKKNETLTLNAINEECLMEWVNALQNVAFRNKNENTQNLSAIEEDNDLYCSSYEDGLFIVSLIPTEASNRCNIDPKCYMLHLTATELQLKSISGSKNVISNWPYRFIRKYGYRDGKFTFEAGRKCSTGEGIFILDHTSPQDVFRCMSSKMKSMKKLISGDVINIDSCENQLTAAASMEAGSRSPLPPSYSTQRSSELENNSSQIPKGLTLVPSKPPRRIAPMTEPPLAVDSPCIPLKSEQKNTCDNAKYKQFDAVTITTSDSNKAVGSTVILKPTSPNLPFTPDPASEAVTFRENLAERDYECIENITEAWKTLGINEVKHNENVRISTTKTFQVINKGREKVIYARDKVKECLAPGSTSIMFDIDIGESSKNVASIVPTDLTYDRLEFLTANNRTSSGYKTIVPVTSIANQCMSTKSLQNEYELISVPDTDSCRKADDTHLGYGVLRKSKNLLFSATANSMCNNTRSTDMESGIKEGSSIQCDINGINYEQVRNPKRV
ncbi:docking protein 1 isoform X1 [Musca domestica]|uniref:Docking protein 1 isoform X1 n=1 Tax=Musca domestica TaxID=7370 RepID=A0ABM3ULP0_MUSDO|nr:docking protein 1 isoform X1 [Musca domestica]